MELTIEERLVNIEKALSRLTHIVERNDSDVREMIDGLTESVDKIHELHQKEKRGNK